VQSRYAELQMLPWRLEMLRDQMIGFLQTAVIFLLLTNTVSIVAAIYALRLNAKPAHPNQPKSAIERNLEAILRRAG
jgi:hypothetical protein